MFWFLACEAYGILVSQTGIKPASFCMGKQTINHWPAREVGSVKDVSISKSSSVLWWTDPAPKKGEDFIQNLLPVYNLKNLDFAHKQIVWDKAEYACILFLGNGLWSLFLSSQLAYCIPGSMTACTHTYEPGAWLHVHTRMNQEHDCKYTHVWINHQETLLLLEPKWQVSKLSLSK